VAAQWQINLMGHKNDNIRRPISFSTPKQHNNTKIYTVTVTVTQYTVTIDWTLIESYFTISICTINEMLPHTLLVTHINIH